MDAGIQEGLTFMEEEEQQLLGTSTCTQDLDLSGRQLTEVPARVASLASLVSLNLSCNSLQALGHIHGMQALRVLDVSFNQLSTLPQELGCLKQLQVLNAAYNHLSSLPDEVGLLQGLVELYLNDNQLSTLPASLLQLSQLQTLHIQFNQFFNLPFNPWELASLTSLELEGNTLQPGAIGSCSSQAAADQRAYQQADQGHVTGIRQACPSIPKGTPSDGEKSSTGPTAMRLQVGADVLVLQPTRSPTGRCSMHDNQIEYPWADEVACVDEPGINIVGSDDVQQQVPGASQQQPETQEQQDAAAEQGPDLSRLVACTLSDVQELPPAAAAALYRSLGMLQTGLQELHANRPLTGSCSTALPPVSGGSRKCTTPSQRPAATSMYRCSIRPDSARPSTSACDRPCTALVGAGLDSTYGQEVAAHRPSSTRPSWLPTRPATGVAALLAGTHDRAATVKAGHVGQRTAASEQQGSSSGQHSAGLYGAGLHVLPPVTFPLAAGVRSMLRTMSKAGTRQDVAAVDVAAEPL